MRYARFARQANRPTLPGSLGLGPMLSVKLSRSSRHRRQPQREVVGEAEIRRRDRAYPLVVAEGLLEAARVLVEFRGRRAHVDRAAGRVLSGQRALRTAQHLDRRDVEERLADELLVRNQLAVDVVGDARAGSRRRLRDADAADVHEGRAVDDVDGDRRGDVLDVGEIGDAPAVEFLAGQHRCRDRHVLEVLLAALGRHDDFLEDVVPGALAARLGRCERQGNCCCNKQMGRNRVLVRHGRLLWSGPPAGPECKRFHTACRERQVRTGASGSNDDVHPPGAVIPDAIRRRDLVHPADLIGGCGEPRAAQQFGDLLGAPAGKIG